jgi:N-methylhydantoinase A
MELLNFANHDILPNESRLILLAPVTPRLTIAIDTGGTFTDCIYRKAGRIEVLKVPSTPDDPSRAILDAVRRICGLMGAEKIEVRHGTTVATNALLERKGARVAFVTTAGFEDTLALARQARPNLYDWNQHRPAPITDMCFGVPERIAPNGSVLFTPSRKALAELRRQIHQSNAESVAISLLFAFANPAHEKAVAQALGSLRLPLSLSHQILPEFREYERGSTVALNAYIAPRLQGYIRSLQDGLAEHRATLSIMQSSGGILSADSAAREAVRTILSGPAGGVIGALSVARAAGIDHVLTFDMGGTSTDVALLDTRREPLASSERQIEGLPVSIPMLDIHTAGAGGGSLAWMDTAGTLHVGPHSAGAIPGPACYGRGEQATVTDANLLLGRLHPDYFLGGAMRLEQDRARKAISGIPTKRFDTIEHLAEGVIRVANARMESALRRVSVERGFDPRTFTLLAFGGAGPLHACSLASSLGIGRVLIPNAPGALSALGILDADLRREFSRTVMLAPGSAQADRVFRELEAEARAAFSSSDSKPILKRSADLRYQGQGYELRVDWSANLVGRFLQMHQRSYGYADSERPVEIVTLRVQAIIRTPKARTRQAKLSGPSPRSAIVSMHRIFEDGHWRNSVLYDRARLEPGNRFSGPAVVSELSATTYVPSGWKLSVDALSNLVLTSIARVRR